MDVVCSGISFPPWLLFLPVFVKIQLTVLIFVLKKIFLAIESDGNTHNI